MTVQISKPAPPATEAVAPPQRRRWLALLMAASVFLAMFGGWQWYRHKSTDVRWGTSSVTREGMAACYGIDVNLVAVTAAGGLVELRYQVVDADKASPILHDEDLAPALVDEESGRTIVMSAPPHRHSGQLQLGATYFFLLANANNALHGGDEVTLVIGDARLEHIAVQQ